MRKQRNIAKTPLNYNYFLRFSIKIFPDFWPQATPYLAAGQSHLNRPQANNLPSGTTKTKYMEKSTVIRILSTLKAPLLAVGVCQLGLFGSTVRDENTPTSDIDILIDFNAGQETYLNFIDACSILQDAFGTAKLDVVTKKGLSPYIGKTILSEVQYV